MCLSYKDLYMLLPWQRMGREGHCHDANVAPTALSSSKNVRTITRGGGGTLPRTLKNLYRRSMAMCTSDTKIYGGVVASAEDDKRGPLP